MAWLSNLGVSVPSLITIPADARSDLATEVLDRATKLGSPWVVKPDIAAGGKGNKGYVQVCPTAHGLLEAVRRISEQASEEFGSSGVVIEEYVEGAEWYISITMDEETRAPVLRLSLEGGVGFDPEAAASFCVLPAGGLPPDHRIHGVLDDAGFVDRQMRQAAFDIMVRLASAFVVSEATMLELNPVKWTGQKAVAVGVACEFDVDGRPVASAYRPNARESHSAMSALKGQPTERELAVAQANAAEPNLPAVSFVEVPGGDVALLVSGGGGSLLCFDYLTDKGFRPACYMDSSPGAGVAKRTAALTAGLSVPGIRGALIGSVVVSLADVSESSAALLKAIAVSGCDPEKIPVLARIAGPNEDAARRALLQGAPAVHVVGRESTLEDCCDLLIALVLNQERGGE